MLSRTRIGAGVVVAVLTLGWLAAVQPAAQEVGPARGALVIVGGAMQDPAIVERFVQLAGGPEAPIVVIPTAGGGDAYDRYYPGLRAFREAGATDLTVLHTTDREVADDPAFSAPLRQARGVWFPGGRQWRLADAYLDTLVHEEIAGVLRRGGVVGGSSAGATILGSYLARGDTATNTVMMGDHEVGFGFLRDTAIDQHLLRRNRQFDLVEVIEAHPPPAGHRARRRYGDRRPGRSVRGDGTQLRGDLRPSAAAGFGGAVLFPGGRGSIRPQTQAGLPDATGGAPVRSRDRAGLADSVRPGEDAMTAIGPPSRARTGSSGAVRARIIAA